MLYLVNGMFRFMSHLLELDPHQDRTTVMISDDPGLATLTTFQPIELFGLAVKLLNLPTPAAYLLHRLRVVLSKVVGDDIVRALGR